ncbi:MAG: hypothetical protein QJR05_13300 [Thermoanaerobacterium sp.]|nr:hypothetical protein [Thermoanaerobacterium sp.]
MSRERSLSLGGMLAAINVILLFVSATMPTSRLFLLVLSSFSASIMVIEANANVATVFYIATSLLAFILIPNKLMASYYACFFGFYGIVKSYIERLSLNRFLEYALKLIVFNLSLSIIYIVFKIVFAANIFIGSYSTVAVFALLQISFVIYDYAYTVFVSFYLKKVKRH